MKREYEGNRSCFTLQKVDLPESHRPMFLCMKFLAISAGEDPRGGRDPYQVC